MAIQILPVKKSRRITRKDVGTSSDATRFHGSTGLFGYGALERDIITSVERPIAGLSSIVPAIPTTTEKTEFGSITGFTASGDEAATPCDDGPTGAFSGCKLRVQFGHKVASTKTMDPSSDINRTDRSDSDLQLIGTMLGMGNLTPDMSEDDMLNVILVSEMLGVGLQLEDHVIDTFWQGDPTNNNVGGGYKEPEGLDLQITTGIEDAYTSAACPARDSVVKDFDFSAPDEAGGAAGNYAGMSLYQALQDMERTVYFRRHRAKARDVETALVMRPETWEWVSEALPCQIEAVTCADGTVGDGKVLYIDGSRNVMKTDEMRDMMVVRINGRLYGVVIDDGLPLFDNTSNPGDLAAGEEASHIYGVPLRMRGNFPLVYNQYKDYRRTARELATEIMLRKWTDDGRFWWVIEETGYCHKISGKLEFRPVLRTPQWAFKLQNVRHA